MNKLKKPARLIACGIIAVWFGSAPSAALPAAEGGGRNFTFLQISDTHWGFSDPKINPDYAVTLPETIKAINAMKPRPDFIVFTGDLTHTTDDPAERRKRLSKFREIVGGFAVKDVRFMPGEHDASLDKGQAFTEILGKTRYVFHHKGVVFIALDNVSLPGSILGDEQIEWLKSELKKIRLDSRIVILTHRPLFNLKEEWDWWTRDGDKALELLKPYKHVAAFYGHIHQLNEHAEGDIAFHAARGLMYPLPAPGSVPKKAPIPWDPAVPYKDLGYRGVEVNAGKGAYLIKEYPLFSEVQAGPDSTVKTDAVVIR
jgi:3',5'-cyclic AMP phosphodiesterase CpdA